VPREYRCESCGRKLLIPEGFGSKRARCPSCGAVFRVPSQAEPRQEAAVTPGGAEEEAGGPPPSPQGPVPGPRMGPRAYLPSVVTGLLRDDEEIIYWGRPSWLVLAARLAVVLGIYLWLSVPLIRVLPTRLASVLACVLLLVLAAAVGAGLYLVWKNTVYVLTSHRVLSRAGVLTLRTVSFPLVKVEGLSLRRGLMQRLFGRGSLSIYVA